MTSVDDDNAAPSFRFKRRKTSHTKRARVDEDEAAIASNSLPHSIATLQDAPEAVQDEGETGPSLKEIIRNRKRPRDRLKDVSRKAQPQTDLVSAEAPRPDQYAGRFAAQTGQVVDSSDHQMSAYVEARLAEQNHRKYGWPIPAHLQSIVAATAPDLRHTFTSSAAQAAADKSTESSVSLNNRAAAGQGKLEEVDLGADSTRTHKDWQRLEGTAPAPKVRMGRDGKPWRPRKRRNSNDLRRDAAVEAVLKEAKIDFFDETPTANARFAGTDDDMVARFRAEYYESIEERQSRKPVMPPGAKDQPKGPKLGGSRSARAAMREREEANARGNKK